MVGLSRVPAVEGAAAEDAENAATHPISQSKSPSAPVADTLDPCFQELENFSCLPDFESIESWFKDYTGLSDGAVLRFGEVGKDNFDDKCEVADGICMAESGEDGKATTVVNSFHMDSETIGDADEKLKNFGILIEKGMENVSLDGVPRLPEGLDRAENACMVNEHEHSGEGCLNGADTVNGNAVRASVTGTVENSLESNGDNDDDETDGTPSSTSSSSLSSDSSDSEDKEVDRVARGTRKVDIGEGTLEEETETEEGEIMVQEAEKMISWSDTEDAEEGDGEGRGAGPIRSKNEIEAIHLPVPPVTVSLQPLHQTAPVGTILSIIGSQVIVEGVEKHNPLSEGSILWINETRLPLGIVDEIFGPVKNPYYVVRFNSDAEVPSGIGQGTAISFAEEFADHVLNGKNLYQKGYDASGENDEEISDEVEFSDDEKEAEYRRMQKMKKREAYESKPENKGKERKRPMNRGKNWNRNQASLGGQREPVDQKAHSGQREPVDQKAHSSPAVTTSSPVFNQHMVSLPPNNAGIWNQCFPSPQNPSFPGVLGNGILWMHQNQPRPTFQFPMQSSLPIQQQIGIMPTMPLNLNSVGLQPNPSANQAFLPSWPVAGLDPHVLSMLQFQMGVQSLQPPPPLQTGVSNFQPSPIPSGSSSPQIRQGRGGGRRGHGGAGRHHYRGGRGNYGRRD